MLLVLPLILLGNLLLASPSAQNVGYIGPACAVTVCFFCKIGAIIKDLGRFPLHPWNFCAKVGHGRAECLLQVPRCTGRDHTIARSFGCWVGVLFPSKGASDLPFYSYSSSGQPACRPAPVSYSALKCLASAMDLTALWK
jgi:hypothetical protein